MVQMRIRSQACVVLVLRVGAAAEMNGLTFWRYDAVLLALSSAFRDRGYVVLSVRAIKGLACRVRPSGQHPVYLILSGYAPNRGGPSSTNSTDHLQQPLVIVVVVPGTPSSSSAL